MEIFNIQSNTIICYQGSANYSLQAKCVLALFFFNGCELRIALLFLKEKKKEQEGKGRGRINLVLYKKSAALAQWLSWLEHHPAHQQVASSIPAQGTYLDCKFDSCLRWGQEAAD